MVLMEADDSENAEPAAHQLSGHSGRDTERSSHSLAPRHADSAVSQPRDRSSRDLSVTSREPITQGARHSEDSQTAAAAMTAQRPELCESHQTDYSPAIFAQLQKGQLPKLEIPAFDGNVTNYRCFVRAFDSRIASKTDDPDERLYYLQTYVRGKPLDIIRGCMHMPDGSGYLEARRLLEKRYGDPDSVSAVFVDVLTE